MGQACGQGRMLPHRVVVVFALEVTDMSAFTSRSEGNFAKRQRIQANVHLVSMIVNVKPEHWCLASMLSCHKRSLCNPQVTASVSLSEAQTYL